MTARSMAHLIGRRGVLPVRMASATLHVPVDVHDVRERFGVLDLQVSPVGGDGLAWVERDRVELADAYRDAFSAHE